MEKLSSLSEFGFPAGTMKVEKKEATRPCFVIFQRIERRWQKGGDHELV